MEPINKNKEIIKEEKIKTTNKICSNIELKSIIKTDNLLNSEGIFSKSEDLFGIK